MIRRPRTRRFTAMLVAACLTLAMQPAAVWAATPARTTAQLAAADPSQDGDAVVFGGEAIGEALRAGDDHVWVNVLSDATAIGVYVGRAQASEIRAWGDYTGNGDRVEVAGTLNVACDLHGGDLDVHASSLRVTSRGSDRYHAIPVLEVIAALALVPLTIGLFVLTSRRRSRPQL